MTTFGKCEHKHFLLLNTFFLSLNSNFGVNAMSFSQLPKSHIKSKKNNGSVSVLLQMADTNVSIPDCPRFPENVPAIIITLSFKILWHVNVFSKTIPLSFPCDEQVVFGIQQSSTLLFGTMFW